MDYRVMGSQTRLHAAKAVPSWPLDQSSPLWHSAPHFCRIRKTLAGSLAERKRCIITPRSKASAANRKTLTQCSLGIIDTSDQKHSHKLPLFPGSMSAQSCNYHPTLAAYRLVLPPDTRTKQKAIIIIIYHAGRRHNKNDVG